MKNEPTDHGIFRTENSFRVKTAILDRINEREYALQSE